MWVRVLLNFSFVHNVTDSVGHVCCHLLPRRLRVTNPNYDSSNHRIQIGEHWHCPVEGRQLRHLTAPFRERHHVYQCPLCWHSPDSEPAFGAALRCKSGQNFLSVCCASLTHSAVAFARCFLLAWAVEHFSEEESSSSVLPIPLCHSAANQKWYRQSLICTKLCCRDLALWLRLSERL